MVIHLTGPDTYRSRARLYQLRDAFIAKHDPRGFNVILLDGLTATPAEFRAAVGGGGLFAKKNFIALNGYEVTASACPPDELAALVQPYAKNNDAIIVIRQVTAGVKKPGRGKKAATTGLHFQEAKHEEFPLQTPAEAKLWAMKLAKDRGVVLPAAVADQLVAATDNDSWRIATEIEKLTTYVGDRALSATDVTAMVPSAISSDMFALTDAISARERVRALQLIQNELAAGVHPLALIAMIARHLRILRSIQSALGEGIAQQQLSTSLGLHPYVVTKAMRQIKKFSPEELSVWHHHLLETDYAIKSSSLDAETMLDLLVVQT